MLSSHLVELKHPFSHCSNFLTISNARRVLFTYMHVCYTLILYSLSFFFDFFRDDLLLFILINTNNAERVVVFYLT